LSVTFAIRGILAVLACAHAAQFPHSARVIAIDDLSHDTKRIRLTATEPDRFRFRAGQFILLEVPGQFVNEWNTRYGTSHREVARPYSFSSAPARLPVFELIVKLAAAPPGKNVPPGITSTYIHTALKVGDTVRFSEPVGAMSAEVAPGRPVVLIAGGTGVAPFVGLLEHWLAQKDAKKRQIWLFLGVRARRDLLLDEQLRQWAASNPNLHYIPALSNAQTDDAWQGETGFINAIAAKYLAEIADPEVFIAGSPPMLEATMQTLKTRSIPQERIHHDPIVVR
jgi:Na+-transporting NADH:ubiquinone oxidoreductase subunit F